jgi:predicted dehydrogenase
MNAEEGKTMLEAARDAERTLVVAAPRRFEVQAKTIRETVENGDLGQVSFSRAWRREEAIPADDLWQIKAESGGGALSISGQEMLDLALWLTEDEPISVSGGLFHRFADNPDVRKTWFGSRRELDAEDLVIALVRCRKSMLALEVDWLASAGDSGVLVVGSKGRSRTSPFKMEVASKGEFVDMTPTFFPETSTWSEQVRAFIEAALGHDKPFPTAEETLRVQRVADAIRESSVTGREIRLSDA